MKDNAIFSSTEVLNYVADAIHENLHTSEDPIGYGYWTLSFHDVFEDLKLKNDTGDKITTFYNFLVISKSKNHRWIFKNICNYIFFFKQEGFIKNADEFIGEMLAWILDPTRSYYARGDREKAIKDINSILERKSRIIRYDDLQKKYVFGTQIDIIKVKNRIPKKDDYIRKIEIIKGEGRLKIYVNGSSVELNFSRGKYWGMLYNLAETREILFNKSFFDYFNSNLKNPLYARHSFLLTKILTQEDGSIVPNIEIDLITQKKKTQQLKKA